MLYNILIIDDSQTMRSLIKKVIRMSSIEVDHLYEADSGKTGIEILYDNSNINLVLADINMPVMDGIEMTKIIKNDETLSDLPIIFITTEGTEHRINEIRNLGIEAFIRK